MTPDERRIFDQMLEALRKAEFAVRNMRQGKFRFAHGTVEKAIAEAERFIRLAEAPLPKHVYVPHKKYPWFCGACGYAEHEEWKHIKATEGTAS